MRHRVAGRGFGRNPTHRRAMFKNMLTSLFEYERIETTDAKAKELRSKAEKLITLAKRGDLHARRQVLSIIRRPYVVAKMFSEIAERFRDRKGGYTRITKIGRRHGDNAVVSVLELLPSLVAGEGAPGKKTRRLRKKDKGEEGAAVKKSAKGAAVKKTDKKEEKAPEKKKAAPKKEAEEKGKKAAPKKESDKKADKGKKEEKKPAAKKTDDKAKKPAKKTDKSK